MGVGAWFGESNCNFILKASQPEDLKSMSQRALFSEWISGFFHTERKKAVSSFFRQFQKEFDNILFLQLSMFSSVAQSCLTLCDPVNCHMLGLPVHHQLPEFIQTHVHWVGDAIQTFHPLSSPSSPALNLSQHQGLYKWVSSPHQVAKVLDFQLSIPGLERSSGEGNGVPSTVFWPGKSQEWRDLGGYSPWGRKELNMSEWLTLSLS